MQFSLSIELQVNCKDKDEWFVFKKDSLQYGECKKNPCLNKTLLDIELRNSVSNETIMFYMLGLHKNDPNRMPYKHTPKPRGTLGGSKCPSQGGVKIFFCALDPFGVALRVSGQCFRITVS
jgi:hypothetical protein